MTIRRPLEISGGCFFYLRSKYKIAMATTNKNIRNSSKVRQNPLRDEFYTTAETADKMLEFIVPG
jgi:hypothetical protein